MSLERLKLEAVFRGRAAELPSKPLRFLVPLAGAGGVGSALGLHGDDVAAQPLGPNRVLGFKVIPASGDVGERGLEPSRVPTWVEPEGAAPRPAGANDLCKIASPEQPGRAADL